MLSTERVVRSCKECCCAISDYHLSFKSLPPLKGLSIVMSVNFDLNDIYAFRALVEYGNFRLAAESICLFTVCQA